MAHNAGDWTRAVPSMKVFHLPTHFFQVSLCRRLAGKPHGKYTPTPGAMRAAKRAWGGAPNNPGENALADARGLTRGYVATKR